MLYIPKKTIEKILESGNYYFAQVKLNQKTLFRTIEQATVEQEPLDCYAVENEKGHGRTSSWYVSVYEAQNSPKATEWKDLRRFIHVHRIKQQKGQTSHSDAYYITNCFEIDAELYYHGSRGHWGIENKLHWVKDVFHQEDKNRIRKQNGPMVHSVLSTIAINLHRKEGFESILEAQDHAVKNIKEIICKIRT